MKKSADFSPELPLKKRVIKLLESSEEYGGPQSVNDLQLNLKISNGSSRSVLVRLYKSEKIERIGKGIYRAKGDSRKYDKKKPHIT